ncbi:MAG: hypothetical protein IJ258_10530 [Methanobrevibacter sp.]|uniref:hypothetical protein n=1 Tax=Methanobrevibacter sp. TaxID=66852 RepID=UPI0025DF49D9|nr:hypothetical protein [Methanobrevibacter sp.]MBQ8018521.1 hypothetical protein [Methanobrevibacter sp.]
MLDTDGFCSGLRPSKVHILLETYRLERESKKELNKYLNYLKNNNLKEYHNFIEYKRLVEKKTPNLKEIYYECLDGKKDVNFDLFLLL